MKAVYKPGLVQFLQEIFLDKFMHCIRNNLPVKHAILQFKKEDDIADVNDLLCELLPKQASYPFLIYPHHHHLITFVPV